jgi:hypothetical protein
MNINFMKKSEYCKEMGISAADYVAAEKELLAIGCTGGIGERFYTYILFPSDNPEGKNYCEHPAYAGRYGGEFPSGNWVPYQYSFDIRNLLTRKIRRRIEDRLRKDAEFLRAVARLK